MVSIGVRHLKANLSRYLRQVQAGVAIQVTERGRPIAVIGPVKQRASVAWAHQLVAEGHAHWNGGKPEFVKGVRARRGGPTASDIVIEDRR